MTYMYNVLSQTLSNQPTGFYCCKLTRDVGMLDTVFNAFDVPFASMECMKGVKDLAAELGNGCLIVNEHCSKMRFFMSLVVAFTAGLDCFSCSASCVVVVFIVQIVQCCDRVRPSYALAMKQAVLSYVLYNWCCFQHCFYFSHTMYDVLRPLILLSGWLHYSSFSM